MPLTNETAARRVVIANVALDVYRGYSDRLIDAASRSRRYIERRRAERPGAGDGRARRATARAGPPTSRASLIYRSGRGRTLFSPVQGLPRLEGLARDAHACASGSLADGHWTDNAAESPSVKHVVE